MKQDQANKKEKKRLRCEDIIQETNNVMNIKKDGENEDKGEDTERAVEKEGEMMRNIETT